MLTVGEPAELGLVEWLARDLGFDVVSCTASTSSRKSGASVPTPCSSISARERREPIQMLLRFAKWRLVRRHPDWPDRRLDEGVARCPRLPAEPRSRPPARRADDGRQGTERRERCSGRTARPRASSSSTASSAAARRCRSCSTQSAGSCRTFVRSPPASQAPAATRRLRAAPRRSAPRSPFRGSAVFAGRRRAARERPVRTRTRRICRGDRNQDRRIRAGERRNTVSRRSQRPAAQRSGAAPASDRARRAARMGRRRCRFDVQVIAAPHGIWPARWRRGDSGETCSIA